MRRASGTRRTVQRVRRYDSVNPSAGHDPLMDRINSSPAIHTFMSHTSTLSSPTHPHFCVPYIHTFMSHPGESAAGLKCISR